MRCFLLQVYSRIAQIRDYSHKTVEKNVDPVTKRKLRDRMVLERGFYDFILARFYRSLQTWKIQIE